MGLFSRLRASSSAKSAQDRSERNDVPALPPPRPTMLPLAPPSPLASPRIPASPSSSSITSRIKPWKKGKGKDQDDISIAGPAYESPEQSSYFHTQLPPPPWKPGQREPLAGRHSYSGIHPQPSGGISRVDSSPVLASNLRESPSSFAVRSRPSEDRERNRLSSGEWKREGGILGKLGFEQDIGRTSSYSALQTISPTLSSVPQSYMPSASVGPSARSLTSDGSVIMVDKDDYFTRDGHAAQSDDEGVEILESNERKQKFWKIRRGSKSGSEIGHDVEELSSPTPRKKVLPSTTAESGTGHARSSSDAPRPRQVRRPSSSFFFRNTSRTSLHEPLDVQSGVDDGSFQLRGFRHISGTSDVEGGGQLESYLAHVKKPSTSMINAIASDPTPAGPSSELEMSTLISPSGVEPVLPPRRPNMSRPPSAAGSFISMDDHLSSAPKVSAATFRRGIRKPSESPSISMTDLESGHRRSALMPDEAENEEEDDVPLGILQQMRRKESQAALPQLPRDSVPSCLSSGGQNSQAQVVDQSPPTNPTLTIRPSREQLNLSQGQRQSNHENPSARTPPVVALPSELSTIPDPPPLSSTPTPPPQSAGDVGGLNRQAAAGETRPPPPPIKPIDLPRPGDTTPSITELPLPPDQMPSTPPPGSPSAVDDATTSASRRGGHARKVSLLEEPLRAITDLWLGGTAGSQTASEDDRHSDGFDPALVMRSMEVCGAKSPKKTVAANIDGSDLLPPLTGRSGRQTLQDRLASVASAGPISPSSVPPSTTPPPAMVAPSAPPSSVPTSTVQSSFARAPPIRSRASFDQLRAKKTSWSDSEDEDEDENDETEAASHAKPLRQATLNRAGTTRRAPSGPRKMSIKSRDISGASTVHPLGSMEDKGDTGSQHSDLHSSSCSPPRTSSATHVSSQAIAGPALTTSKSSHDLAPPLPMPTTHPTIAAVPMGVSARSHLSSPSPASSHSGVTSETLPQGLHPMTPQQEQVALTRPLSAEKGHSELPRGDSGYPTIQRPPVLPEHHRDRRLSTATAPGGSSRYAQPTTSGFSPSPTMSNLSLVAPPGVESNAYRHMMKQHWQAQYMAAAFRASEQEWERQSAMSDSGRPEPIAPSHSQPHHPHSGASHQGHFSSSAFRPPFMPQLQMPVQGYPFFPPPQSQTPTDYAQIPGMPFGYPFFSPPHPQQSGGSIPPSPSFGPGHFQLPVTPGQGQGMYAFAPGPQSVYGGEFGPPPLFPMHGAFPPSPHAMPMGPSMGMGMGYGLPLPMAPEAGGHTRPYVEHEPPDRAASDARRRQGLFRPPRRLQATTRRTGACARVGAEPVRDPRARTDSAGRAEAVS